MLNKTKFYLIIGLLLSQTIFAADKQYNLKVDGLVCPFCEYNIKKKLSKIDDVLDVKVNLKEGSVNIIVAEGKNLQEDVVKQEITNAGFTLKSIKEQQPNTKK